MDPVAIGGIVTAICGGAATVIGAIAILRKATGPHNAAVAALRSLWDWVEISGLAERVPARIRRRVLDILDRDYDGDDSTRREEE